MTAADQHDPTNVGACVEGATNQPVSLELAQFVRQRTARLLIVGGPDQFGCVMVVPADDRRSTPARWHADNLVPDVDVVQADLERIRGLITDALVELDGGRSGDAAVILRRAIST